MKKRVFFMEASYLIGMMVLAIGTAFMEMADFGMSMVVAPAYLLHLKVSEFLPFFSFGMAEYTLQAVLLILMMGFLRKFKISYLFSFVTAVLYGFMLDGAILLVNVLPFEEMAFRVIYYVLGLILCAIGVSLLLHTYISPEVYELIVKETSAKYGISIPKVKTCYDCISCAAAIVMSFFFFGFGHFEGVKLGTILCALINGWMIGVCSRFFEKYWEFKDGIPLRKMFEK